MRDTTTKWDTKGHVPKCPSGQTRGQTGTAPFRGVLSCPPAPCQPGDLHGGRSANGFRDALEGSPANKRKRARARCATSIARTLARPAKGSGFCERYLRAGARPVKGERRSPSQVESLIGAHALRTLTNVDIAGTCA